MLKIAPRRNTINYFLQAKDKAILAFATENQGAVNKSQIQNISQSMS